MTERIIIIVTERLRIKIYIYTYFQTLEIMEKMLSDKNEPGRHIREKGVNTMEKSRKTDEHREHFENEHASGALRASPSTAHTNSQA